MALKAPPRSLPSALCWPHTLWVPTNSQSHQPGRSCLEKTGGPTEQQSSASPGSECPSGTQGLRGSCHPQSGKLDVCYANVHRHTKLPRFLEEFTLGICLWSQRPANFTPGRPVWRWVGGCTRTLCSSSPQLRKAAAPRVSLSPSAFIPSSDWFSCCVLFVEGHLCELVPDDPRRGLCVLSLWVTRGASSTCAHCPLLSHPSCSGRAAPLRPFSLLSSLL